MNRKSIAITSTLFALTLAIPPPFNVVGVSIFIGLKLYRTALLYMGVNALLYSGQIIAFISTNQISKIDEATQEVAHTVANATLADPGLFPYVAVGLVVTLLVEVGLVVGVFVFPAWVIRKRVYHHVKGRMG